MEELAVCCGSGLLELQPGCFGFAPLCCCFDTNYKRPGGTFRHVRGVCRSVLTSEGGTSKRLIGVNIFLKDECVRLEIHDLSRTFPCQMMLTCLVLAAGGELSLMCAHHTAAPCTPPAPSRSSGAPGGGR